MPRGPSRMSGARRRTTPAVRASAASRAAAVLLALLCVIGGADRTAAVRLAADGDLSFQSIVADVGRKVAAEKERADEADVPPVEACRRCQQLEGELETLNTSPGEAIRCDRDASAVNAGECRRVVGLFGGAAVARLVREHALCAHVHHCGAAGAHILQLAAEHERYFHGKDVEMFQGIPKKDLYKYTKLKGKPVGEEEPPPGENNSEGTPKPDQFDGDERDPVGIQTDMERQQQKFAFQQHMSFESAETTIARAHAVAVDNMKHQFMTDRVRREAGRELGVTEELGLMQMENMMDSPACASRDSFECTTQNLHVRYLPSIMPK